VDVTGARENGAVLPTSEAALVIVLLAIAPGYIAAAAWARARTWKGPAGDLRTILQSLVLSAVVQAVLVPLTVVWVVPIRDHLAKYPLRVTVWSLLAVLVVPAVLGLAAGAITDKLFDPAQDRVRGRFASFVNGIIPAPTAPTIWDWLFVSDRVPKSGFLVVEFKDGARVAGAFAERSMALTSPEPHGLFLEREWQLDTEGNVYCELPGTRGLLVPDVSEVRWMRILESTNGEDTGDESG
jgi:hypothetical protein